MIAPRPVLILSSFVSASAVGGGYQAATLAALGFDPVLAPTVLFGRHPGLGPPGGGPVADTLFADLLNGVAATGVFAELAAVISGYFASPDQVATAARAIDAIRAVNSGAWIVVDPIMGDDDSGLYVKAVAADAAAAELVARADLVAPNAWELGRLTGMAVTKPDSVLAAARRLGRPVLVSSIAVGEAIGVAFVDGETAWLATHERQSTAPKGTGDLLTAHFTAESLTGAPPREALARSVAAVAEAVKGAPAEVYIEALK